MTSLDLGILKQEAKAQLDAAIAAVANKENLVNILKNTALFPDEFRKERAVDILPDVLNTKADVADIGKALADVLVKGLKDKKIKSKDADELTKIVKGFVEESSKAKRLGDTLGVMAANIEGIENGLAPTIIRNNISKLTELGLPVQLATDIAIRRAARSTIPNRELIPGSIGLGNLQTLPSRR